MITFSGPSKARDPQVKSAISQARTIVTAFYAYGGRYGIFNCQMDEMKSLCNKVQQNSYQKTPLKIINLPLVNPTSSCFYAPLNEKSGTTWFCGDSTGNDRIISNSSPCSGLNNTCGPLTN